MPCVIEFAATIINDLTGCQCWNDGGNCINRLYIPKGCPIQLECSSFTRKYCGNSICHIIWIPFSILYFWYCFHVETFQSKEFCFDVVLTCVGFLDVTIYSKKWTLPKIIDDFSRNRFFLQKITGNFWISPVLSQNHWWWDNYHLWFLFSNGDF